MKNIYDYINLPKEDRQTHLKLDEDCVERGAGSYYFKGLLAYVLDTTVPTGHKIHLCHACHNGACGNPNHMYWGTAQENRRDQVDRGTDKSVWQRTVEKYGLEGAKDLNRKSKIGNQGGSGNLGKPKSEEHKKKIAEAIKRKYNSKLKNAPVT